MSELTGLAVVSLFETSCTGGLTAMQDTAMALFHKAKLIFEKKKILEAKNHSKYEGEVRRLRSVTDIARMCRNAALYTYAATGFKTKPDQITNYSWVSPTALSSLMTVLQTQIPNKTTNKYEVYVEFNTTFWNKTVTVVGIMDILTDGVVWEVKCTGALDDEHRLQLAVYAWIVMNNSTSGNSHNLQSYRSFQLLNAKTGQMERLTSSKADLDNVMTILVDNYIRGDPKVSDEKFLESVRFINNETTRTDSAVLEAAVPL